MIRIFLADDHSIVREGMKQILALARDVEVVGEAVNGSQLLEILPGLQVDVIVLDMSMPGISGANLITRVTAQESGASILVLSMHNEPQIARRALNAGAAGYLTKDSEPDLVLSAIRKVAGGGRYIDPMLAEKMVFDNGFNGKKFPHEQLSERELQILRLLAKGSSINDVADKLAISNKTVSTHKMRVMQKMDFASNADLVRYALEHGVVD